MFKSKAELDSLFGDNEAVAGLVIALCATMFDNGVRHIHVGGLMRLLGVDFELAKQNDDKVFELPDDFYKQIQEMGFERIDDSQLSIPKNIILH
jgi:hypothetical protein